MFKKLFKHYNKEMLLIIWTLAWPTMLEQLMQTAVQYIDTAMVGSLGTQATAAVGSTSTIAWLVGSTIEAISIGFLAFISQSLGANNEKAAKHAVSQAAFMVFVVGSLLTVVVLGVSPYVPIWMQVDPSIQQMASMYFFILYTPLLFRASSIIFGTVLRAAGDTRSPMKIGILVNVVNIVLNFIFIYPTRSISMFGMSFTVYGVGMGVLGAAVASAISYTIGGILIAYVVYMHPRVSFKGESLKPDMQILKPCMKVAFPNMLQRFGTCLGYVAFASIINSIGELSTAAHTIANTVESAFYIPGYGMEIAAATLVGNAYGAKDEEKMKDVTRMFIPLEVGLMIVSGALLFIFAPSLMRIFSKSSDVIALGTTVLRMVAVSEPFYGFSIIVEGFMQGVGNTKIPFVYNVVGMWCVRIVGTFICVHYFGLGLISAWACMIAHNMLIFVLYLYSYISRHWNPLYKERMV